MTPDDRLERLERRLHDLEALVLDLQAALKANGVVTAPRVITKPTTPRVVPSPPASLGEPISTPSPAATPVARPSDRGGLAVGTEQWFGQRGLLAAGVFQGRPRRRDRAVVRPARAAGGRGIPPDSGGGLFPEARV